MSSSVKRLLLSIILLLVSFSPLAFADSSSSETQGVQIKNPATDLWRAVRQREFSGNANTNAKSNSAPLINAEGNKWRQIRRKQLLPYGAYFMAGVISILFVLMIIVRRVKIPDGRSGKLLPRMSEMQRISHWLLALLVGFMAITGLILLFGRFAIIPLIGVEAFSPVASASKEGHNLFGPIIIVSLLLMLVYFIRHNLPALRDFKWIFTAGGLLAKGHLKIGFFNAGEKLLYWLTLSFGITLAVTGLLLLFPEYQTLLKLNTQLTLIIHAITALLLIALSLAHIWMATTVEGTIDAITSGSVDENWAKTHHSVWYEEMLAKKTVSEESTDDQ